MPENEVEQPDVLDTDDFRAFTTARNAEPVVTEEPLAPAVGEEETPPSEPADEADQNAADSEPEEEEEQEEDEPQEAKPAARNQGLNKRMRTLTGEIKTLQSRLAELTTSAEPEAEAEAEVVSAPEVVAPAVEDAVAPMLKDYEDNEDTGQSAWDQYEAATKAFNKAETAKAIAAALGAQKTALEAEHAAKEAAIAKQSAEADWNKAAARFPNFNDMARADVTISTAMENVMRMDPEVGTALVMYFGEHPEEAKAIALSTLAKNDKEWGAALARAGMKLGEISAKLSKPPAKGATPIAAAHKGGAAPTPPTTKKVTSASRPPTQIRGGTATPKFDLMSDADATDFGKWNREREKQLAHSGKR